MADVQLSGVAPAGGAGAAGFTGSIVAPVISVAPAAQIAVGSKVPIPDGATPGDAAPIAPPPLAAGGQRPEATKLDDLQVKDAVKSANQALAAIGTQLVFVFDDQAHHLAVKLLDIQTQKVVQQIPTAAMQATASALSGPSASGALVDTKA